MTTLHSTRLILSVGLVLSLGWPAPACAASRQAEARQAEAMYRKERADCINGRSTQDLKTCLREAGAVLAEARRGRLGDVDAQVLAANALLRCQRVPLPDRLDCERLARGEGQQTGSVPLGAILKEIITLQLEAPAAGPAASAASDSR